MLDNFKKKRKKFSTMPISTVFFLAWRNLVFKKLRTSLTVLGIIIGIGAIFFLLSISIGLQRLVANELVGGKSIKMIDVVSAESGIIKLENQAAQRINDLPNIEKTGKSFSAPGIVEYNGSQSSGPIFGVDDNYQEFSNLNIIAGQKLNSDIVSQAVISVVKLKSIGIDDPKSIVGKSISLSIPMKDSDSDKNKFNKTTLSIVGVYDNGSEGAIFVSNKVFEMMELTEYSQIKVLAKNVDNIPNLRKQIESMGFETSSPVDTIGQINQIFKYFNLVLIGFGTIGMSVAILGMFNTLTMSLIERTKEIGLMFALGSRKKDTRRILITEAVLLSSIGSFFGVIFAIIIGQVVNILMNNIANSRGVTSSFQLFATPLWLVLGLIIFMIFVGLLVVYFPARRAEKINPIDALRRE